MLSKLEPAWHQTENTSPSTGSKTLPPDTEQDPQGSPHNTQPFLRRLCVCPRVRECVRVCVCVCVCTPRGAHRRAECGARELCHTAQGAHSLPGGAVRCYTLQNHSLRNHALSPLSPSHAGTHTHTLKTPPHAALGSKHCMPFITHHIVCAVAETLHKIFTLDEIRLL